MRYFVSCFLLLCYFLIVYLTNTNVSKWIIHSIIFYQIISSIVYLFFILKLARFRKVSLEILYALGFRINLVFHIVVIVIFFAQANYLIYCIDSNAYMYIDESTSWIEFAFDFLHYSFFMGVFFGNTVIVPLSPFAESLSIIEVISFIIVLRHSFSDEFSKKEVKK
ncbi:hypothetical protein ACIQ4Z_03845 [Peribacillus asahii]|uniref:hypothetical protein n=1 Tax=Peribacillus asahii TaxID=228899 RepID=UPI0038124B88